MPRRETAAPSPGPWRAPPETPISGCARKMAKAFYPAHSDVASVPARSVRPRWRRAESRTRGRRVSDPRVQLLPCVPISERGSYAGGSSLPALRAFPGWTGGTGPGLARGAARGSGLAPWAPQPRPLSSAAVFLRALCELLSPVSLARPTAAPLATVPGRTVAVGPGGPPTYRASCGGWLEELPCGPALFQLPAAGWACAARKCKAGSVTHRGATPA